MPSLYNPRMIVEIKRPKTVTEAVKEKSSAEAAFLGGGTWLNARSDERPSVLISLENLGLSTIAAAGGRCVVGATATLQQIVDAADVPAGLRDAAALCGSRTLRNMITLGGELGACPEDSAIIAVLIALEAQVSLAGRKKPVTVEDFLRDRPKDLILSASLEAGGRLCRVSAIARTSHSPRSLLVVVSARAAAERRRDTRVVVSDCVGQRVRLRELEETLEGTALPEKARIEEMVGRVFSPGADLYASAAYKRYLCGVLVADVVHALAGKAART